MSLPVWQALHLELSPLGLDVVTVALDAEPEFAYPWIDAAAPTHRSLVDRRHITGGQLGFVNVPMALWIDAEGRIVRPAEQASVTPNGLRGKPIPEGLPERIRARTEIVAAFEDHSVDYLAALRDWAAKGPDSAFVLPADEVIARSRPRSTSEAIAAASFELGEHLYEHGGLAAAAPWWRQAHRLHPSNWTYKRQAWMLASSKLGDAADLIQEPTELFEGNWLDDVLELGGPAAYAIAFSGEKGPTR